MADMQLPLFKIASRDITNEPLLQALASFNVPIVLSTGMASPQEVDRAVAIITKQHQQIIIAQCTSEYPSPLEHANLRALATYRKRYQCLVGMSDHTPGIMVAIAAAVQGACFVEKHVTLSRAMRGTDHAGSLEMEGLRRMANYIRQVEVAQGDGSIEYCDYMSTARNKLSKSLSCRRDLEPGDTLREEDLELRCPGTGLPWSEKERIVGLQANKPINRRTILRQEDFTSPTTPHARL
jgi:sialic acid synthase